MRNIKYLALAVIVLAIIGVTTDEYAQYRHTAPERVAANFINNIADGGNDTKSYNLTSPAYQTVTPFPKFVSDFKTLDKTNVHYAVNGEAVNGTDAVVGGYIYDLNGKNYNYVIKLVNIKGNWQVDAVAANKA